MEFLAIWPLERPLLLYSRPVLCLDKHYFHQTVRIASDRNNNRVSRKTPADGRACCARQRSAGHRTQDADGVASLHCEAQSWAKKKPALWSPETPISLSDTSFINFYVSVDQGPKINELPPVFVCLKHPKLLERDFKALDFVDQYLDCKKDLILLPKIPVNTSNMTLSMLQKNMTYKLVQGYVNKNMQSLGKMGVAVLAGDYLANLQHTLTTSQKVVMREGKKLQRFWKNEALRRIQQKKNNAFVTNTSTNKLLVSRIVLYGVEYLELSDDTDPKSVLYEIYKAKHENVENSSAYKQLNSGERKLNLMFIHGGGIQLMNAIRPDIVSLKAEGKDLDAGLINNMLVKGGVNQYFRALPRKLQIKDDRNVRVLDTLMPNRRHPAVISIANDIRLEMPTIGTVTSTPSSKNCETKVAVGGAHCSQDGWPMGSEGSRMASADRETSCRDFSWCMQYSFFMVNMQSFFLRPPEVSGWFLCKDTKKKLTTTTTAESVKFLSPQQRQHLCITIHGTEKCVTLNQPGNAAEIAKMFRVFVETENAVEAQSDSSDPVQSEIDV
ncbi:hypothetical protein MSG28_015612 [Choristoneura fumiferana]|uniref:Uncharacterized protein n=1 Tax=Choristoneura fumiferana TaxID=7141 RepID=A0ACC0KC07_CHOFU|nr:hypothetical protein MSG28_015612 [Choristoneura fumiferana]